MFRKLTFLALLGGAIAALIKLRSGDKTVTPTPEATTPEQTAAARPDQPEQRAQEPVAGAGGDEEAVIPDTSADDPTVREQEDAAPAEAGAIGGEPDTATVEPPTPEMRPVVEGAGDAPETFENTDEQGR